MIFVPKQESELDLNFVSQTCKFVDLFFFAPVQFKKTLLKELYKDVFAGGLASGWTGGWVSICFK